ncbi:MAG: L-aspartate oxidase [Acidimicrobiia bacterium]
MFKQKHIVVVGSGVAGLTCALSLIEFGHNVTIVTKSQTADSATWYAQGGVASAMFEDDTEASHFQDTIDAGAGLCDLSAVEVLVKYGAGAVNKLISRGAHFDKLSDGSYARTREGGHHNPRIIHAGGDATGEEIERSLVKAATNSDLSLLSIKDFHMVSKLLIDDNSCIGVECLDPNGNISSIKADHVVLASGGAGQLFSVTTNPVLATGDGIAIALQAGAICADLEFMQFHPTALHVDNMPRPLVSEALRGEGSILRDENGEAFMKNKHELADLAPRDVVSREIAKVLRDHNLDFVYLDATHIKNFYKRFPTIFSSCEQAGIDPSKDYLPVSPAAHYFCGGVVTDLNGATSIQNLWAAGEVACNGVHGANRLASNSLLDGLVFGDRVASAINSDLSNFEISGVFSNFHEWDPKLKTLSSQSYGDMNFINGMTLNEVATLRTKLQKNMTRNVGVVRSKDSLVESSEFFENLVRENDRSENFMDDFSKLELKHLLILAREVNNFALVRCESRGCHTREDFPSQSNQFLGRQMVNKIDGDLIFTQLPKN